MLLVGTVPDVILKILIYLLVFFIGATIFSFLNVVIEYLPLEEDERTDKLVHLLGTRKCPHCGQTWKLSWCIPIFSWIASGRKCGHCSQKISIRHTLIECLGGILAVLPLLYYGISMESITVFLVYCVIAAIAVIDMDTQYIPPELNIILAVLGLISIVTLPGPSLLERVIGIFVVSLPMLLIVLIIPEGFGGGDIKMMAAVGILLGWKGTLMAFIIGLFLGGAYGVFVLLTRKLGRKEHFAFGPFLAIGIAISLYARIGAAVLDWYIGYVSVAFEPY